MAEPNAELAYKVLDHIDAHPEQWKQDTWVTDCGTSFCFAGWALELTGHTLRDYEVDGRQLMQLDDDPQVVSGTVRLAASRELGLSNWVAEGLFEAENTREDLGYMVAEIFGPRPHTTGGVDGCRACREGGLTTELAWRECAHRADYTTAAEHERECPFHNHEVDENGRPIDDVPPNAGSAT